MLGLNLYSMSVHSKYNIQGPWNYVFLLCASIGNENLSVAD